MLRHCARRLLFMVLLIPIISVFIPVDDGMAQGDPEVFVQDLGNIDLNTLGILYPRALFRPIDDLTPRMSARAQGMAGTYVGLATGAEALAWNPAGMAFSETSTMAADFFINSSSGTSSEFPLRLDQDIPGIPPLFIAQYDENLKNQFRFGFIGASGTPFRLGSRPVHIGVAYRRHTNVAYPEEVISEFRFVEGTTTVPVIVAVDNEESGSIEAATVGLAYQLLPGIGIGASANYLTGIWRAHFATLVNSPGGVEETGQGRFALDYEGLSFELGARAELGGKLTLSGWVGLPHNVKVTNGSFRSETIETGAQPVFVFQARQGGYDLKVPLFYSVGAAFRIGSRLTLAADFNSRPWGDAEVEYHKPELFTGPNNPWGDLNTTDFYPAHDVQSFHGGLEYLLVRKDGYSVPVRLGFAFVPLSMSNADPLDTLDIAFTFIPHLDGVTIAGGDGDPAFYGEDQVEAFVYGFGASLILKDVSFHGGLDARRYDMYRLFFESTGTRAGDFLINPNGRVGKVERLEYVIRFSAEYRF